MVAHRRGELKNAFDTFYLIFPILSHLARLPQSNEAFLGKEEKEKRSNFLLFHHSLFFIEAFDQA